MRLFRPLSSLITISLVVILLSTILLAQSSSSITDAVIAPLFKQGAALKSLSQPDPENQAKIQESYGKLPLSFEVNQGQADSRVKFLTRTGAYSLSLTEDEAVFALRKRRATTNFPVETRLAASANEAKSGQSPERATENVLRMKLRNANVAAKVTGMDELAGMSNYFIGNDPAKWRTNVPTYAKVKYEGIYSGIDLIYYGNQRQLEYDFIVAPGADPHKIEFDVRGVRRIRRDEHGDLVFKMGEGEIRWHKPVVYQEKDGTKQHIAARYAITDANRVGFELAKYDASRPLYIDPLIYSTYLGGSGTDLGKHIAVDSTGNAYITGETCSTDFPTKNPLQAAYGGGVSPCGDAFVTKIDPTGSALIYSTYLGGSAQDFGEGIAVDSGGNAYVTGYTYSSDFPTANALQAFFSGGITDAFVTKINPTGSALVYSTYLGGSGDDLGLGIAVDSAGNAYITGQTCSTDFPTKNPLQAAYGGGGVSACGDAFVTKIDPTGSALVYSTYLGGSTQDFGAGIAVDSMGNVYLAGSTSSTDFPTKNPLQPIYGGGQYDTFAAKINPIGSALVYSTYLGGGDLDLVAGVAVDAAGNAYFTGQTFSTDFPVTPGALQVIIGGVSQKCFSLPGNAFVTKINPLGSAFVYSTYLGGCRSDVGLAIAVDRSGDAYVSGGTTSTNFPTTPGAFLTTCDGLCAKEFGFVTELNPLGTGLVYSTYLGNTTPGQCASCYYASASGIALDRSGIVYVTGTTSSPKFPTVNAFQPFLGGGYDAFLTKLKYETTTTRLVSSVNPSVSGHPVIFTATVSSPLGGTPTGQVAFRRGAVELAKRVLDGGTASFTPQLSLGLNVITAVYGGDPTFSSSTSLPVNQFVLAATITTLSSSQNPSIYGEAVTFTAAVTSSAGTPPDVETVTFKKGTAILGTRTLSSGSARFTTSTLPTGTNPITAMYGGDSNFGASKSKAVSQVVNKAATKTALVSSLNPSKIGQSVTFTASVVEQFGGKVTGTVTFYNGTTALKTLSLSGGVAKFAISTLIHGTHAITSTYNGGTNLDRSSASLTQTVN
jgi:hypothetical protein